MADTTKTLRGLNLGELREALDQVAEWMKLEKESLDYFHKYAHMFGGQPGDNVFTFVLKDALRHRGMTLEQFRVAQ